jgi:hypothetical protein
MTLRVIDPDVLLKKKSLVFGSLHEWLATALDYEEHETERESFEPCSIANANCEAPAGYQSSGGVTDGEESAAFECECCSQPVCGECSSVIDGMRLCDHCHDEEEE